MSYESYVLEAIERALALEIAEEELGRVVCSHASAMANVPSDQDWAHYSE